MHPKSIKGSLIVTMAWVAFLVSLAFGLAALSVQHLSAMGGQESRLEAQSLARSAASLVIEKLLADPNFGKAEAGGLLNITLAGNLPGAVGLATFNQTIATQQKLAYSTNNFGGMVSLPGSLGTVPKVSAFVVGEGRSGGAIRRVQVILAVPDFPYAVAAGGPVNATGGVLIGALKTAPMGPIGTPTLDSLLPADILSDDGSANAMYLGAGTQITGDARSPGTISLDPAAPGVVIEGQIKNGAVPEPIPQIPLDNYDPQALGQPFTNVTSGALGPSPNLGGLMRCPGPALTVTGGLNLDGCMLYVDGDLNVQGGINGTGIVAATGAVNISGQSNLVGSNSMALLAGGDLSIRGGGAAGSYFQGLVYTEGSLSLDKVTMVGTLIAGGASPKPIRLHEARALQLPSDKITITHHTTGPGSSFRIDMVGQTMTYNGAPHANLLCLHVEYNAVTTGFYLTMDRYLPPLGMGGLAISSPGLILNPGSTPANVLQGAHDMCLGTGVVPDVAMPGLDQLKSWLGTDVTQIVPGATTAWNVNPNAFLKIQDKIRVSMWKE